MPNIWNTIEAYAWRNGMKHKEYVALWNHYCSNGDNAKYPLSLDHYDALCFLFDDVMDTELK